MVHLGEPIEGTLPITTTSTTITVPGIGTWPRATFSPLPYNALEASNSLANLERTLRPLSTGDAITTLTDPRNPHHAVFLANTLGALSTLEAMPFFPWHQHHFTTHIDSIIGLIGGRIARIHGAYPRTGKDAVHAGEEIAKSTSKAIITAWMVRPNRAYAPRSWVVDEGMGTMMEQLDVLEVQAGINAAQQAFTFVGTPDRFHHLIAGTTSHDTLAYRALLQAIDRALLLTYAADPARLKKVAARHAHLLCDANP